MTCYRELREQAARFVAEHAARGRVLILASVREAADEVALEACERALVGVSRAALREWVTELSSAELNRRELVPVGRLVREALAARVTAEAANRNGLAYLGRVSRFPGFARALTDTIEELRLNFVRPEQLRGCGESGTDLALLLENYARELGSRDFADYALRVELATGAVGLATRETAVVVLDVAPRTRAERTLLATARSSAAAWLDLSIGEGEPRPVNGSLASVRKYLFAPEVPVPDQPDDSVRLFSSSGEALECVEIARRIGAAAANGVPFDQIGILMRAAERYQPLVLEGLHRAGIPAHCARGSVRPDAAGRSFLALLHCAQERLPASRFAEYLSLGQMAEDEEPLTPALWERLLTDAAVIGGPARWKTRIAGLREELHARYPLEEDEDERKSIERRIAALDNLAEFALPIIGRLGALPGQAMWGDWIAALADLAEFTLREPGRIVELLEQLEPMSDIGPVGLGEVLLVIGPRLNSLRAGAADSRYGKVWVGSIEEARGMAFQHVFVPGVNEGLFPRPPAEDPLLFKQQRGDLGIELRAEDTELLRVAVACASQRLDLSFSRLDLLTGRERVPSFYAFAVHRAAGGPDLDVREFEDQARSATRARIGWPAPPDPADAIDDAEFDLATLAPLAKGSGQYLKSLPGRAVPSLRARWSRWNKSWKAVDGLVLAEIGNALEPYRLAARAWSPSVLQQYARCPYRFALRGIFGLRPVDRPAAIQRLDPATRGNLYHSVQFELLRELGEAGALPVDPGNLASALQRLDTVLERVVQKAEADLAPAIPEIWRAEIQVARADLRGWLQRKAEFDSEWSPEYYELSFGLKDPAGRDARSRKEPVELDGGFLLQGSIDVVERHRSGVLRVVDHKTGRVPDPRPDMVGMGEILQPSLYAMAAERMLGEPVSAGRLYYSTLAQNYTALEIPLHQWTRRRAQQVLESIDSAMHRGFLPAAPRKDGCKGCEYITVCGPYEEDRVREKSPVELKELREMRTWR